MCPGQGLALLVERLDFQRGDCINVGQRKAAKASRLAASTSRSLVSSRLTLRAKAGPLRRQPWKAPVRQTPRRCKGDPNCRSLSREYCLIFRGEGASGRSESSKQAIPFSRGPAVRIPFAPATSRRRRAVTIASGACSVTQWPCSAYRVPFLRIIDCALGDSLQWFQTPCSPSVHRTRAPES